jgi:hypothetical protein
MQLLHPGADPLDRWTFAAVALQLLSPSRQRRHPLPLPLLIPLVAQRPARTTEVPVCSRPGARTSTGLGTGGTTQVRIAVVEINETPSGALFYITRGYANNTEDPAQVSYEQIAGKKGLVIPKVGWIGIFATRAFGSVAEFF